MNPILAHLVTTGLGPIYDGIGHLILSHEDLVPVLAFALLAGLHGPKAARWTLFVLPITWLVGGVLGLHINVNSVAPEFFWCGSFLLIGILVASDFRLPQEGILVLAVALGMAHGVLNGLELARAGRGTGGLNLPGMLEMIGVTAAMFVLLALVSGLVVSLRRDWTRIVVRVAGSWIAAVGLLWLGWTIRAGQ